MRTLKIEDLIWLAGIFDGEGSTGLHKSKRGKNEKSPGKWRIMPYWLIANTDLSIINEVKNIGEMIGIDLYVFERKPPKKEHSIGYHVACKNFEGVYKILKGIYPYVRSGNKKAIAEMTIKFIENRNFGKSCKENKKRYYPYSEEDWKIVERIYELNQKGQNRKWVNSSEAIRQTLLQKSEDIAYKPN